jgi:branched-subunit amino acid ABC-type transport system permease component
MNPFLVKLWQALVSGLSIGSIYALIAEGYYITFITTGALNFSQGEFLMIGALFGLTCYVSFGLPYALARISHRTNARLGGQFDRHVSGVAGMLAGGAGRRGEC